MAEFWSDWWWLVAIGALIALGVLLALWRAGRDAVIRLGPGFSPTFPLVVPVYTITLLVLLWADGWNISDREALGTSVAIAVSAWILAAAWRGPRSTARGVAPEEYERLRSEYEALANSNQPNLEPVIKAEDASQPDFTEGPLALNRIAPYLQMAAEDIGFIENPTSTEPRVSGSAWNSGTGYLEIGRRFDHVRNSLVAHQTNRAALMGQAQSLDLRLAGSNVQRDEHAIMTHQLEVATDQIESATTPAEFAVPAATLYQIATALASFTHSRQRQLLRMRSHQHWLVVTVQMIAAVLLAIAVLTGASKEASTSAVALSLVGSISGMVSLLHVRSNMNQSVLGEDFGLFRVELARAFTLSGMAAVIAVYVMANLPLLSESAEVFDPATPTPVPTTEVATPVASEHQRQLTMRAQDAPTAEATQPTTTSDSATESSSTAGDEIEWRSLGSIYSFANEGAWLIALLAGWVPERLFRTLTDRGSRLRLDIQSVSALN